MRKFLFVVLFVWMVAPVIADDQCPAGYTPTKYTQLEYIESTGTQYIDTGFKATSMNLRVETSLTNKSDSKGGVNFNYFGFDDANSDSNWFTLYTPDGSVSTFWAGNSIGVSNVLFIDSTTRVFHDVIIETTSSGKLDCWADGVHAVNTTFVDSFIANPGNFALFTNGGWGVIDRLCPVKMKYLKLGQDGELVRNFIPAKRNSDGEIGMYDTVTGHFFTNAGTGEFIAGPEILTENTCFPCPPNTYKDFVGNGDCTPCPDTFSSPSGATSINECGRILHIGDYVAHMPFGRRTEHGLCTMFDGKKYCADMYERQ